MKRVITLIIGLVIAGAGVGFVVISAFIQDGPTDFESCAKKYQVEEGSPRTCRVPNGALFVDQHLPASKN